jgi:tripartite-type tricarboxylate transporter receptor subunit TctC
LAPFAAIAQAADYPSRPIRFIVPNAPAGGSDTVVRALAQKMSASWKQQVVVDNRPGAGSALGAELVAKAAPDGYTIGLASISFAVNASLRKKLPYDTVKDFSPITQMSAQPHLVVVHPAFPAKSVKELIALSKARAGRINYGSSGTGSGGHLAAELFKHVAGVSMSHIPYKGIAPAMTDLIGGQIDLTFSTLIGAVPYVKSGRLQAIAVTAARRTPVAPEVPTVSESGLPGFESGSWNGVVAPAKTSSEIVMRLHAEIVRDLQTAELREWISNDGAVMVGSTPAAFAAFIKSEIDKWAKVIKAVGITTE